LSNFNNFCHKSYSGNKQPKAVLLIKISSSHLTTASALITRQSRTTMTAICRESYSNKNKVLDVKITFKDHIYDIQGELH